MIKLIKVRNEEPIYINKNCIVSVCEHNFDEEYNTGITTITNDYIVVKGKLEDIIKQIEEDK